MLATRSTSRILSAVITLAAVSACGRQPDSQEIDAMFDRGEKFCLEGRFDEAQQVFKAYLNYRPEDAGAHYYLARTYSVALDFRPVIAEGEYQTALRLFLRSGRKSPIDRFGHDYFELICYVDSAKVLLRQVGVMLYLGAPPGALQDLLQQAMRYLDQADAVMPGTQEVRVVRDQILDLAAETGVQIPTPEKASSNGRL